MLIRHALSFLKIISEKTSSVDGKILFCSCRLFSRESSELICFVKSNVLVYTIIMLGLLSNRAWIFVLIFYAVAPGKFLIFTEWFFDKHLSLILLSIKSSTAITFYLSLFSLAALVGEFLFLDSCDSDSTQNLLSRFEFHLI